MKKTSKFSILVAAFAAIFSSVNAFSGEGNGSTMSGPVPLGCYTTGTYSCASSPFYSAGEAKYCDFTGHYGAPIECTQKECGKDQITRRCVEP